MWWVSFDKKLNSGIVILFLAVPFAPPAAVCFLVVFDQFHTNKILIIDEHCCNMSSSGGSGLAVNADTNFHGQIETLKETWTYRCLVSVDRPCPSKVHYWPMQS